MKFDFVIGNPPYNEEFGGSGENETYAAPIYNKFIDAAYTISDRVELVHPARFLFNVGSTPKAWNEKMLHDKHLKILEYEAESKEFFPNTKIRGGIEGVISFVSLRFYFPKISSIGYCQNFQYLQGFVGSAHTRSPE